MTLYKKLTANPALVDDLVTRIEYETRELYYILTVPRTYREAKVDYRIAILSWAQWVDNANPEAGCEH